MSDLPAPLVPPDCDLRDFGWMAIDIARLFGSEFHALSTDGEWRAGVILWLRSFHQVPAASLPDDDVALARLAEFGRDVKAWKKVKAGALRGWTLCSDGRRYHRTVAEKALEAWVDKLLQRKASGAGNAKRYGASFDPAPFDEAVRDSLARLAALNPSSRALTKRFVKAGIKPSSGTPDDVPEGDRKPPTGNDNASRRGADGTPSGTPDDVPEGSHLTRPDPTRPEPPIVPLTGDSPPGAKSSRAKSIGDTLPDAWMPKSAHYEAAAKLGRDAAWVDDEAQAMRAWTKAEAHRSITRKADWDQAFHNRIRENAKRGAPLLRAIQGGTRPASPVHTAGDRPMSGGASAGVGIAATIAARRGDHS